MTVVEPGLRLGLAVAVLTALAVGVAMWARLGVGRAVLTAAGRAALQLTVLAVVLAAVLDSLALALLFVAVMAGVATGTAGLRVTSGAGAAWAALPVVGGALPVLVTVLAAGVLPLTGIGVLPVTGLVIGGAMTATALAGRRALDELRTRAGEYEAALALGFDERAAGLELCRSASVLALVPALDTTRTVGLVTLPGTFVGMLLGGSTAAEAAAAQILILVGMLVAQVVAVALTLELVVRGRLRAPAAARAKRSV